MKNKIQSSSAGNQAITSPEGGSIVTFALISFNQENFIAEAVEGAFAQTYQPLEVILSDDCSNDRTFEIIKTLADSYKGKSKIVLNRNETNLGVTGHVNLIAQMASGDLVVVAAGDDISYSCRTQKIYDAWRASNYRAYSIVSGYELIDESGNILDVKASIKKEQDNILSYRARYGPNILGASHAFAKESFRVFGPIERNCPGEDGIIGYRSYLLGPVIEIPFPLVQYRQHSNNLWNSVSARLPFKVRVIALERLITDNISEKTQMLRDTCNCGVVIDEGDRIKAIAILSKRLQSYYRLKKALKGKAWMKYLVILYYYFMQKVLRLWKKVGLD